MSITLDATLKTAQDGNEHKPIIEIISKQFLPDIPFDGQLLTSETDNESSPNSITHSSGRLAFVYAEDQTGVDVDLLKYVYTDTARTFFTSVSFSMPSASYILHDASLTEMSDGNIGIIYKREISGNFELVRKIVTVLGVAVSEAVLSTFATSSFLSSPYVITLQDNSYLLVYGREVAPDWKLWKRTSSDFITWAAETEITGHGLPLTQRKDFPSLLQITTGDIFLWFDNLDELGAGGEERTNVYYSISADNGATWSAGTALTSYADFTAKGIHGIAAQKAANQMHIVYTEERAALHIDKDTAGWICPKSAISEIHFDSVNRKLYVVAGNQNTNRVLNCIHKIDVDTWTIDKGWDCSTSTPQFNSAFCNEQIWWGVHHGEGRYTPIGTIANDKQIHIALLDGEADSITHYHFADWATYGITQNVTWALAESSNWRIRLESTWFDELTNRLYALIMYSFSGNATAQVGYIDIAQPGPSFTFIDVVVDSVTFGEDEALQMSTGNFTVMPGDDIIIIGSNMELFIGDTDAGQTVIYNLTSGGKLKTYNKAAFVSYPLHGLDNIVYLDGKIYGSFVYEALHGESLKKGLCIIDTVTDVITYELPSWASVDDYLLHFLISTNAKELIISTKGFGITIFNTLTRVWTLHDNNSLPGLQPDASDFFMEVAFDETSQFIYAGGGTDLATPTTFQGVVGFSINGFLKRSFYYTGTFTASWAFVLQGAWVAGLQDFDAVIALDPSDQSIFTFWTNKKINELSIKWDKENSEIDFASRLIREIPILSETAIDGTPNMLSFSISDGHLFDPTNLLSLLAPAGRKGRKITYRLGETISGSPFWQTQGTFVIAETSISYARPQLPIFNIVCRDIRDMWQHMTVQVSDEYSTNAEAVISDIIQDNTSTQAGDIIIPTFDNSTTIFIQWIDTLLTDILDQIANRYGYFIKIDVDNKIRASKISDNNAIDHVYSNNDQIIDFTPDQTFSDFTNQIVVTGEERDFIEVLFDEERVASLSGTVGWYGFDEDFKLYYSEDKSRCAKNPRLEVIESATSIGFALAGDIDESITEIDPNNKFVVVTVEAPNLIAQAIAFLAVLMGTWKIPGGWVKDAIQFAALQGLGNTLSAIGNFKYAIWAQPVGQVRRQVQASADDLELQAEIGETILKKFSDELCYSPSDCKVVADFELLVARLQRTRIRFQKLAHLQDEAGDTIQIVHPVTKQIVKIFITNITRSFKIPSTPDGDGHVIDNIEGWVL